MAEYDYYTPTMVVNEALQALGLASMAIGDIQEGSKVANTALLCYASCRRQLIRGAHWDFARREVPLHLVADASGTNPLVGRQVPAGFMYSYQYPQNCAKLRFIPANWWTSTPPVPADNIQPADPSAPILPGLGQPPFVGQRLVPSRFLLTSDPNYIPEGAGNQQFGQSPVGQTLILSNIKDAKGVYTFDATWPNLWDPSFRLAMVSYLAAEMAPTLLPQNNMRQSTIDRMIQRAQMKIQEARTTNGNESWANADIAVDWMRVRVSGGNWGTWTNNGWGGGPGTLIAGWDSCFFSGNSAAY